MDNFWSERVGGIGLAKIVLRWISFLPAAGLFVGRIVLRLYVTAAARLCGFEMWPQRHFMFVLKYVTGRWGILAGM